MNEDMWKQIRRLVLMAWGLSVATYLIVVEGSDANIAIGIVSAVIGGFGARYVD